MKRWIPLVTLLLLLCGCQPSAPAADTGARRVVCTVFPLYDWVVTIAGADNPAIAPVLLTDNGIDLHNYQPSADDIIAVAGSDLFLYVGGASDAWAADVLQTNPSDTRAALSLYGMLRDALLTEETVEGMQQEAEEEGDGTDEHLWLSLANARTACAAITDALCALDPGQADGYRARAAAYDRALSALDDAYRDAAETAARDTLLFCDRFPFRYLTEAYGLRYYAAFAGCSAETEADFDTIAFLTRKLDELKLPAVLVIEGSDTSIARTVIAGTADKNAAVLTLDSLQSVTADDMKNGVTYLSVMEENLAVLRQALD